MADDSTSTPFRGPFVKNPKGLRLRRLWNLKVYNFLRTYFETCEMDPRIGDGGHGIRIEKHENGYFGFPTGEGNGSVYSSFFRVIDASEFDAEGKPTSCRVGVTNGSSAMLDPVGYCGAVKVNGVRVDVAALTSDLSAAGKYHVWIHSWIDAADGEQAEIIVGDVDTSTPPDNPNGGLAFASQLAGRVTVALDAESNLVIAAITQDYLRGGEHSEYLFGDCDGSATITEPA
jgi:hypothetical protein